MDEDILLEFINYNELSYIDLSDDYIMIYLNNNHVGNAQVYTDRKKENRKYITINHEVVYLDTLRRTEYLTITHSKFLDWYFYGEKDTENTFIKYNLVKRLITSLYCEGVYTLSIHDLLRDCNQKTIPFGYTEQGSESRDYTEIGEKFKEFKIELIKTE